MASQSSGDTASGRAAPPVTSSPVFPESCDSAAASAFVSAAAAAVDALSVVAPSVGEPPPCSPQALRDKAIIPASAAARMRFAFVFFIILFSFFAFNSYLCTQTMRSAFFSLQGPVRFTADLYFFRRSAGG